VGPWAGTTAAVSRRTRAPTALATGAPQDGDPNDSGLMMAGSPDDSLFESGTPALEGRESSRRRLRFSDFCTDRGQIVRRRCRQKNRTANPEAPEPPSFRKTQHPRHFRAGGQGGISPGPRVPAHLVGRNLVQIWTPHNRCIYWISRDLKDRAVARRPRTGGSVERGPPRTGAEACDGRREDPGRG